MIPLVLVWGIAEGRLHFVNARRIRTERARSTYKSPYVFDHDLVYRPRYDLVDAPKNGRFRVLVMGDSLLGRPNSLVPAAEAVLNSHKDLQSTELINAGVPGYTNYQELIFLKKYGIQLRPDLVGIVFCLNDLHRFLHNMRVDENGKLIPGTFGDITPEAMNSVGSWPVRLARMSRVLMWMDEHLKVGARIAQRYQNDGYSFDYRPDFNTAWQDSPWQAIDSQMQQVARLGQLHGFRVFVVVVPFAEQLRKDYLARNREYVMKPQRKLKKIAERLHLPYLDVYPDLVPADFDADLIHLTPHGKAIVAGRMADLVREEELIPKAPENAQMERPLRGAEDTSGSVWISVKVVPSGARSPEPEAPVRHLRSDSIPSRCYNPM